MRPFDDNGPFHEDEDGRMDIAELSRLCGMEPDEILEYSRLRYVSLQASGDEVRVDVRTLHRLRRICMLREDHAMASPAIGYVLGLMDRLEEAEKELRVLRERQ